MLSSRTDAPCLSIMRRRTGAHRRFVKDRTTQANQIRGLLTEFSLVIAQGVGNIAWAAEDT
jgi:transposase